MLTPRLTLGLAPGHLWAPDRLRTAPFPRDLGSDLTPPCQCADWLNLPCAPPPTSNQAVVTMVTGRAAASLVVPGRGKGGRKGRKVRSWIWAGDNPTFTNTHAHTEVHWSPASGWPGAIFPGFPRLRGWGKGDALSPCRWWGRGRRGSLSPHLNPKGLA